MGSSPLFKNRDTELEREIRDFLKREKGDGQGPASLGDGSSMKGENEEDEDEDETPKSEGGQGEDHGDDGKSSEKGDGKGSGGPSKGMKFLKDVCNIGPEQLAGPVPKEQLTKSIETIKGMIAGVKKEFEGNQDILTKAEEMEEALKNAEQDKAVKNFKDIGKGTKGMELLCKKIQFDITLRRLQHFGPQVVPLGSCRSTCTELKSTTANEASIRAAVGKDHKCLHDNIAKVEGAFSKVDKDTPVSKLIGLNADVNGIIYQGFVFHVCTEIAHHMKQAAAAGGGGQPSQTAGGGQVQGKGQGKGQGPPPQKEEKPPVSAGGRELVARELLKALREYMN